MDPTGLPIPIGGSEPLSTVFLELSSNGLRLTNAPSPLQKRGSSFPYQIPEFSGYEFMQSQGNNRRPESDQFPVVNANSDHTLLTSHASFDIVNAGLSSLVQNIQINNSSGNNSFSEQQRLQAQRFQPAVHYGELVGQSSASNTQQLQHHSTNFNHQTTIYENDCQLLLDSMKSSLDQRTNKNQKEQLSCFMRNPSTTTQIQLTENKGSLGARPQHSSQTVSFQHHQQGRHLKQRVSPIPSLSPMAARAHMNLLHKMEKNKPNPEKQPLVEEQPFPGTQPLLEKKAQGEILPEKIGVSSVYRPGRGAERLREYMIQQKNRPKDNDIQFWRNLVAEFFAPSATKRWCMSSYKNIKQIDNLSKVAWQCNMCHLKPCCGFEISEELLPRLHKIKYDVGILEEHLHIDTPHEYQGECGQIFLHYQKAAEESEYKQVRIVRHGQLRVVFSPDLKICSWEFCAQHHKEYLDRTSIIPQARQLGAAMKNYRHSAQDSSSVTPEELQKRSDVFISSAYQMLEALGMPLISQIGIAKRYVRSLQISEVLNVMHDLIDYSQEHGVAPKESMAKFPCLANVSSGKYLDHQSEQHQSPAASSAPYFEVCAGAGRASGFYGIVLDSMTTSSSTGPNNHKKQRTGPSSSYAETPAQTTPICFSTPLFDVRPQEAQTSIGKSGTESAAENVHMEPKTSASMQQPYHSYLDDPNNDLSTVEKIIQEVMAAQPHNGVGGITGHSDAENKTRNMASGSNAFGNNTCGGNSVTSNRTVDIDVENYQSKKDGINVSAPDAGTTSGAQMDVDIFPKDAKENYLPKEYSDQLHNEFVDFGSLHELLE